MVLSRAFTVDGVPRMLPFVDLLNHHPSAGEITISEIPIIGAEHTGKFDIEILN